MLYRYHNYQYKSPTLEITEKEIIHQYQRRNWHPDYPQPVNNFGVKSQSINRYKSCNHLPLPKTCQLVKFQSTNQENPGQVLEMLRYQLNNNKAKQTHLNNVRRSLERRLQAAKMSGDYRLVALLQEESQQLEINA